MRANDHGRRGSVRFFVVLFFVAAASVLLVVAIRTQEQDQDAGGIVVQPTGGTQEETRPDVAGSQHDRIPVLTPGAFEPGPFEAQIVGDQASQDPLVARFASLEDWFESASRVEVLDHIAALKAHVEEGSMIEANARFDRGEFDVVGTGSSFDLSDWDESLIRHVRVPGSEGGAIRSVILPREEFPDLYASHDEMRWLQQRLVAEGSAPRGG